MWPEAFRQTLGKNFSIDLKVVNSFLTGGFKFCLYLKRLKFLLKKINKLLRKFRNCPRILKMKEISYIFLAEYK